MEEKVTVELGVPVESEPIVPELIVGQSVDDSGCTVINENTPKSNKPECEEYRHFLGRAKVLVSDLLVSPVETQMRRLIKKKSFSATKCAWMDWIAHELLLSLTDAQRLDLSVINTIMYAVAAVFSFKEGDELRCGDAGVGPKRKVSEPKWKMRLERRVVVLRKEADILRAFLDKKIKSAKAYAYVSTVMKKYRVDGSRDATEAILFNIRNQITVIACKIRRYIVQTKAKQQNELFYNDKKKFYRSIFEEGSNIVDPPNEEAIRKFWEEKIWGDSNKYKGDASWLDEIRKSCKGVDEQEWTVITEKDVSDQLARSMNWKAAGHDGLSNFWIKSMPSTHAALAGCLSDCVERPEQLPGWVVKGRTTLLAKSKITSDASLYRPIACLTTYWKCLSGVLSNKISEHLEQNAILAVEQQGGVKNSYGTKTQLLINKNILDDAIRRRKNLSMLYIDYAKAYDSVPHKWLIEVLTVYKISPVIIQFLLVSMQFWSTLHLILLACF